MHNIVQCQERLSARVVKCKPETRAGHSIVGNIRFP